MKGIEAKTGDEVTVEIKKRVKILEKISQQIEECEKQKAEYAAKDKKVVAEYYQGMIDAYKNVKLWITKEAKE